jgi:hypothetical protein
MTYDKSDIAGTWLLDSWVIRYGDRETHPFGPHPVGLLCYNDDGYMNASIARADRPPLATESVRASDDAAQAAAFASFFNYGGSYTVEGDVVRHDVIISLNPNLVGKPQFRTITMDAAGLTLSATESMPGSGKSRTHILRWRRA